MVTPVSFAARSVQVARRAMAFLGALAILLSGPRLGAQQPISRADAIQTALGRSVLVTAISADTLAASARLRSAREYPNPSLSLSYSCLLYTSPSPRDR